MICTCRGIQSCDDNLNRVKGTLFRPSTSNLVSGPFGSRAKAIVVMGRARNTQYTPSCTLILIHEYITWKFRFIFINPGVSYPVPIQTLPAQKIPCKRQSVLHVPAIYTMGHPYVMYILAVESTGWVILLISATSVKLPCCLATHSC